MFILWLSNTYYRFPYAGRPFFVSDYFFMNVFKKLKKLCLPSEAEATGEANLKPMVYLGSVLMTYQLPGTHSSEFNKSSGEIGTTKSCDKLLGDSDGFKL